MSDQDKDSNAGAIAGVVIAVVIAIATTLFAAIGSLSNTQSAAPKATAAEPAKADVAPAATEAKAEAAVAPTAAVAAPAPQAEAPKPTPKPTYTKAINFFSGSAKVPAADHADLVALANELKSDSRKFRVIGYTDNVGNEAGNKVLSQARAESVLKFLESKGVPANKLSAEGAGSANPVADNATVEGRAKNRRIEFVEVK